VRLRHLVRSLAGLSYQDDALDLFHRRLAPRVEQLGLSSFEEYVDRLQQVPAELDHVFEVFTTKETYFFRQEYQLTAFSEELLPRLVAEAGPQSRLTLWSAGCSTGEEVYTLAMLLSESPLLDGFRVRVIGTDLCASNIETAERGIYRPSSFRSMGPSRIQEHFSRVDSGLRVGDHLRRMVHFSQGNLLSQADVRSVGRVDVIFCRNVLIYFDEASRQKVTESFFERVLPGGYLLLGHSESLLNAQTEFEPLHLKGDLVYRRPTLERASQTKLRPTS
jgi:chemotaxis protein methyltransferase CheR